MIGYLFKLFAIKFDAKAINIIENTRPIHKVTTFP
jgi:type III secretory pathway component EscU